MVMEHIVPTFKELSSLQAIGKFMTSIYYHMNIQLAKFITQYSSLKSDQCNLIAISQPYCMFTKINSVLYVLVYKRFCNTLYIFGRANEASCCC